MFKFNDQTVWVTLESSIRRGGRNWISSFVSMTDHLPRITFDQLYETLAHGAPGEYILVGA